MLKHKHISHSQRARQTLARQRVLQASLVYERILKTKRRAAINKSLSLLKGVPPSRWAEEITFEEPYLSKILNDLYLVTGRPSARDAASRLLSQKSDVDDVFTGSLRSWMGTHMGEKIHSLTGNELTWLKDNLASIYEDSIGSGIEDITEALTEGIKNEFEAVADWQIRRIIQTETMTAMNVAGNSAVNALGVKYSKTWSIAGINTRPSHEAMDGITVDQMEPFIVSGYSMDYPMDGSGGAPPEEIINCSCTCIYLPRDYSDDEI